jgi:type IV pilus assembly protein PilY1
MGIGESIDPGDMNADTFASELQYHADHCFWDSQTPHPDWPQPVPDDGTCIDDFWHASINGRGLYADIHHTASLRQRLQPESPIRPEKLIGQLALGDAILKDSTVIYQTRYDAYNWTGDVLAFEMDNGPGQTTIDAQKALWSAAQRVDRFRDASDSRRVVSYGGRWGQPTGHPFRFTALSDLQKRMLGSDLEPSSPADKRASALVDYLRGNSDHRFRPRDHLLGDIVNSIPVVVGETLFVGANDGMLHAFDTQSGNERFAFVPHGIFSHLVALGAYGYNEKHRFLVDGTPTAGEVLVDQYKRNTYLVGGYGKGGKGYYCLLVRRQFRQQNGNDFSPYQESFNVDTFQNGVSEENISQVVQWEYPPPDMAEDGMDNNQNGIRDEQGEFDPDIGFSVGRGYAVSANVLGEDQFRPVVIFPNGYNSVRGRAVLYVVDIETGALVRKIDTGAGGDNGLSTPALIDADFDRRIDYAYAGDLKGNLWKFDLRSPNPQRWSVAYGVDQDNNGVIDAAQGDRPMPVFQASHQAITARPDVMFTRNACAPLAAGFMVVFGTGKYLGASDKTDRRLQSIYGIWDYGDNSDDSEYLGYIVDRGSGQLSSGLRLVPQTILDRTSPDGETYREISSEVVDYQFAEDVADEDGIQGNNDGRDPQSNPVRDVGWFLDFPSTTSPDADPGERVTSDVIIRDGKIVVLSQVPETEPCSTGRHSWLYLMSGCFADFPQSATTNDDRILGVQQGRRFDTPIRQLPMVVKEEQSMALDQILILDEKGNIEKIPFMGETWGIVHWRQNL